MISRNEIHNPGNLPILGRNVIGLCWNALVPLICQTEPTMVNIVQMSQDPEHWEELQERDPSLRCQHPYVAQGARPSDGENNWETAAVRRLLLERASLELKDGVLTRRVLDPEKHQYAAKSMGGMAMLEWPRFTQKRKGQSRWM